MLRAVLDTNVLASGFRGYGDERSTPGEILRRWSNGAFALVISEVILDELRRTFADRYFAERLSAQQQAGNIELLRREAQVVPITHELHGIATHPEDDLILSTALSARADVLVTGDRQLLRLRQCEGVAILSPRGFLDVLEGG